MNIFKFSDIQDAFLFVSSSGYGMNSAVLCKNTGQIYYHSVEVDMDEITDEELDWDTCIDIPHKNDLDLGQELVFEFVNKRLPDEYQRVRHIFQKRGAYNRYKNLLESKGLLQSWFDFEGQREEEVLRQWCEENEIKISG